MMTDANRVIAEFDQNLQTFIGTMPMFMWSYYQILMREGFSKDQAFQLVRDWQIAAVSKPNTPPAA
jgi:hypothetical protein